MRLYWLVRALVLWALLIGQAVIILAWGTGWGWRHIDSPYGADVVIAILILSGLAGCLGEWIWKTHRRKQASRG